MFNLVFNFMQFISLIIDNLLKRYYTIFNSVSLHPNGNFNGLN